MSKVQGERTLTVNVSYLNAATEAQMKQSMNCFSTGSNNFGLTISTRKSEVSHQLAPCKSYVEPVISIDGEQGEGGSTLDSSLH